MTNNLPRIYTLAEAAEYLRMTNRGVAKVAKRHGLCMVNGRDITFTEDHLREIPKRMEPQPSDRLRPEKYRGIPPEEISRRALEFAMSGKRKSTLTKDRK